MKTLIFGATGSAGGAVLRSCLQSQDVEEVRAITRRPLVITDKKLRTFTHSDYLNYALMENAFTGVDACLFCLGVSVTQTSGETEYRRITRDFAMAAAQSLKAHSPAAAFHYVSGGSASLNSRYMWARVKAEAERDLIALVDAVCWRPGFIDGEPSNSGSWLNQKLRPVFRLLKPFPKLYIDGRDLGFAMIQATIEKTRGRVIENAEIREIARRYSK